MRRLLLATAVAIAATAASAKVPNVVTDMPVVQSLAAQVMGDLGTPEVIVTSGADPHDYQLRPSQARALANADVIFWVGHEMTPWLEDAIDAAGAAKSVALLDTPGTHIRDFASEDHNDAEAHDGHDHIGHDPHAWLDPDNARAWLGTIAGALGARDPGNADAYRANADAAAKQIENMDAVLIARAKRITRGIVVSHGAYGYLAEHFGLNVVASLSDGDAARPGAAHLSEVKALLDSGEVACIFPEAGHDPKSITTLAEGTGVAIGKPLDPAGLNIEAGAGLYTALMSDLIERIVDCAG